jgi:hypothetical protein
MKHTLLLTAKQTKLVVNDSLAFFTGVSSRFLASSKNKSVNNLFWSLLMSDSITWAFIVLLFVYLSTYLGHALHDIVIRH